jgi:ABC-type branched-subunit amino acid transport system permease subunit
VPATDIIAAEIMNASTLWRATLWGPALGAAILVPLSEYSRIWFGGTGRTIDLILYGILILLVCMWAPERYSQPVGRAHSSPRGP